MLKPFSLIFFVLVMVWFGSIFITTDPQVRMDRSCVPVSIVDKAATSGMMLLNDGWATGTHKLFEEAHYGCRFIIWRMFYEEDWQKARQAQQAAQQAGEAQPAPTPSPSKKAQ